MADFAVHIEALHEKGKGTLVLAVRDDEVLIAHEDKTLHWHAIEDCALLLAHSPMLAKAQPNGKIHLAGSMPVPDNRAARRREA